MKHINLYIAGASLLGITLTVLARYWLGLPENLAVLPVMVVIVLGGTIQVSALIAGMFKGEFGSDLLAGISIVTSLILGEYLAGALVVLMLSGGTALEEYAMQRASSVLDALAKRMPTVAHRRVGVSMEDIAADVVRAGDEIVVLPHELCPVDGVVIDGRSSMDESYLTGEPYRIAKGLGSEVISGAINGEGALVVRASREAKDSRYVKIMMVMDATRQRRPRIRRLADQLGMLYTPLAILIALMAWYFTGNAQRFLAVLVVATPCPLIIAIPVCVIGAISWSARRGIIIKDPVVLERAHTCEVLITDKTGTLTIGEPELVEVLVKDMSEDEVLQVASSLERFSNHPLAQPVIDAAHARHIIPVEATEVHEIPGQGLRGMVKGREFLITSRRSAGSSVASTFEAANVGLECLVVTEGRAVGLLRFRDEARPESKEFVSHLGRHHDFKDVILLSGDRSEEVEYLAQKMNITKVYAGKSPEEKVDIVREETRRSQTMYLGDGINDAPALTAASVGIAFGPRSEITSEAAGAVILEPSLRKVDQLLHISAHMRRVALQSAIGGMGASVIGMFVAASGYLSPVAGALLQEAIDLAAVLNALRASSLATNQSNHI
jgi:heavy metal translocating P-type ATPase